MFYTTWFAKKHLSRITASDSNYGLNLAGPWDLFLKDARQILPQLVERPRGFE
jgi:hypothetical protein